MIKRRIFTNTSINFVGKLISYFLQLFIITFLIKSLGKETYGIVVLALALVANTNLLEAGFGLSVTKYVAEFHAKNDRKRLLEIINTNFVISLSIALFFSAVLISVNEFFLENIFTIPDGILVETRQLIRILLLLSIIEFLSVSLVRIAEGYQRYSLARTTEVLKWFLRALFIIIVIEAGMGLSGVGVAYLGAGAVNMAILYACIFGKRSDLRVSPRLSSQEAFRLLWGFSIWILISKIFSFLLYRINTFLIGIFLPPVNLTYYNVAFKVYEVVRFGGSLIASTLVPVTSELNAFSQNHKLSLLFHKSTKYTAMIMLPVLAVVLIHMDRIIELWVGSGFSISVVLARLFIASLFLLIFVTGGAEMMVGLNRVRELVPFAGAAAFVNLTVSILLITKIGVTSVVIGNLISTALLTAGYIYKMLQKFEISFIEFARGITNTLISAICLIPAFFIYPGNLYSGGIVIGLYYVIMFIFMVDRDDRHELKRIFSPKM